MQAFTQCAFEGTDDDPAELPELGDATHHEVDVEPVFGRADIDNDRAIVSKVFDRNGYVAEESVEPDSVGHDQRVAHLGLPYASPNSRWCRW